MKTLKEKIDKQYFGIIIGLVLPPIATFGFYTARYFGELSYFEFLQVLFNFHSLGKLISISVLPNLFVFLVALKLNYLWVVRGILISTVIYAVLAAGLAIIGKLFFDTSLINI